MAAFVGLVCATLGAHAWAQSAPAGKAGDGLWQDVSEAGVSRTAQRQIVPSKYRTLSLDNQGLARVLASAPKESQQDVRSSNVTLSLPLPDGKYGEFRIVESPIMQDDLAAKYPQIRTYLGQGVTDPSATLRFDVTPKGFRAQILSAQGTLYIDPYQNNDKTHYISYDKRDYANTGEPMQCTVKNSGRVTLGTETVDTHAVSPVPALSSGETLRTYRLALSATGEYTQFHGGTVADALGGMITTMNRVNGIYERELGVRMVLVNNTDLSIYTNGATDPFTNNDGETLLGENQYNLDLLVGSANYDIGHIFSTGGGGIAALGSVCGDGVKGNGVTGSSAPTGDSYDVDYVAHEMGHQFGGPHTFNSTVSSCGGGNREATSAYETGSGITIMAYAGICGSENTQPNSEDYFHRDSLNRILAFVAADGACSVNTSTGNTPPTVNTPAAYTIPARTPFTLTATGADVNNDALTYVWEQFDLGASTSGTLSDNGTRPIFRSFDPSTSPSRTFPSLRYILNNANVVPATAPLPGTTTPARYTGELLPTTNRTLNFRVTARDNRAGGGGTNEASTVLTVVNTAGPFAITGMETGTISWAAGSTQTVTWDVANTNAAPVNAANVAILLSLDGGNTFPVVLAPSVPNNGSASVTVPAGTLATTRARLKVAAVGNVFFDINGVDFAVTSTTNTAPAIDLQVPTITIAQGSPQVMTTIGTAIDTQDAGTALTVTLGNVPADLVASASISGNNLRIMTEATCALVAPTSGTKIYPIVVTVTDTGGASASTTVNVAVSGNKTPTLGTYSNRILTPNTNAVVAPSAQPTDANNNLVGVTVSPSTLPGGGTVTIGVDNSITVTTTASTTFGYHKIRATAVDTCGATEVKEFVAQVTSVAPILNFRGASVDTGNNLIEPGECNAVTVSLQNEGASEASAIATTLTTTTPGVTIAQATSPYANLAAAATGANTTAYQVGTDPGLACYGTIDLRQTTTYAGGGSPRIIDFTLPIGRAAGANYAFTASTGGTITTTGTLLADSRADDAIVPLTLPADFGFTMLGTPVPGGSTISVSTNGNIQFVPSGGTEAWGNTPLPAFGSGGGSGVFPVNAPTLFVYWDDIDTSGTGKGIFTELVGTAPNRTFKVEWRAVLVGTSTAVDVAVIFRENSNLFDMVYKNAAAANGGSATIGWQNADHGTALTAHSVNSATIVNGTKLTSGFAPAICTVGPASCSVGDLIFKNGFEP
jgi:hypothetical protein